MGFNTSEGDTFSIAGSGVPAPRPDAPIGVYEQLGAAFDIDNTIQSIVNRVNDPVPAGDPDFDPFEHLAPEERLNPGIFQDANSLAEMDIIRERVKREQEARRLMADGPLPEILASAVAVVADPVSFIPIAGPLAKAVAGIRVGSRVGAVAAGTALEVGVSEVALQATQESRPIEETIAGILLGGAFGAGIGGLAAKSFTRAQADDVIRDFVHAADEPVGDMVSPIPREGSAGAADASRFLNPEDTQLANSARLGETLAKLAKIGLAAPALEMMASPIAKSRELIQRLTDTGMISKGEMRGQAGVVGLETKIDRHNTVKGQLAMNLKGSWRSTKKALKARGEPILSQDQFYSEIGKALRRGDVHEIPEVAAAAQQIRRDILEPYKDILVKEGHLPKDVDVKTAASYYTRVYNREKIQARKGEFLDRVEAWLRRTVKAEDVVADAEYRQIAKEITDRIQGSNHGRVPLLNEPISRGPLKERTFNIPDEDIADFLEDNVLEVMNRYISTVAADIEFKRAFGNVDITDTINTEIRKETDALVAAATSEKERIAIGKKADRDIQVLQTLAERIRGVNSRPADPAFDGLKRLGKAARTLNYLRLLGMVTLSSVPDVGRVIMEEGLARSFGGAITALATGFKTIKLAKNEGQMAGTIWEIVLSTRARAIMDTGDRFVNETKFERFVDNAGQQFGNLTLLNQWNTVLKSFSSMMISSRILSTVEKLSKGQKVSARDMRKLAQGGIDENMAKRIAKQSEHWDRQANGVIIGATEAWTDQNAVDAFRDALLRDIDHTIITPGRGDAPLWTGGEIGKTIFQFKRFAAASTQRMLVSGLQARDMQAMNGIMVMMAMGMAATAARDYVSKGELRERTLEQWINEGVDRSGIMAMFYEGDAFLDKFAGLSLQRTFTGEEASRFQSRDLLGQAGGPLAGGVSDIATAVNGLLSGDVTGSDLRKVRRTMPFQNVPGIGLALNGIESEIADQLDLPANQAEANKRLK